MSPPGPRVCPAGRADQPFDCAPRIAPDTAFSTSAASTDFSTTMMMITTISPRVESHDDSSSASSHIRRPGERGTPRSEAAYRARRTRR